MIAIREHEGYNNRSVSPETKWILVLPARVEKDWKERVVENKIKMAPF